MVSCSFHSLGAIFLLTTVQRRNGSMVASNPGPHVEHGSPFHFSMLPVAVQHWIVYLVVVARVHDDITMMSSCTLGCGRSLLVMGIELPTSFQ